MPSFSRTGISSRISGINTTAQQITSVPFVLNEGIQLIAYTGNAEYLWIGFSGGITANQGSSDGFPLAPGASIFIPIKHPADVYVRSTTTSGLVLWYIGQ